MAWHEILAWVIIAVAFVVAVAWVIRKITCPASRCEGCDKDCPSRKRENKKQ